VVVDSRSNGSVLIGGRFDASQEGLLTKDDKFKHQDGNEGRQAAKTGCGGHLTRFAKMSAFSGKADA
jgi:hypothetical protein